MFFRRPLAMAALLALAGCSLYEGPPPARKKEFSQGSLGCLKDFNAKLVLYFDGMASPADVNRIADCSIGALRAFGELVRGENRDRFTAQEVRHFLQRYFLDDTVFSDGLMREIMRVKQALVGGKETDFTPVDLKEAEELINVFRDVLLRLQPSMPISLERVSNENVDYVENETRAIADVGEILGRRITEKDSTYSFEEMGRLCDELVRTFPAATGSLGSLRGNLKIAGIFKEMMVSPGRPRGTVSAAEWRILFREGSRWLGNYLKYLNLQGKYSDWTRGNGRARFSVVVGESIDLLERVVARHCPQGESQPGGGCTVAPGIPFKLIQEVMENLDWDGTIAGVKFEKSTIKRLVEPVFRHFFAGTDTSETGRSATGLTADHLDRIRALIREWIDGARYVEGVYTRILRAPDFGENATVDTQSILKTDVREVLRATGGVTEAAIRVSDGLRVSFSHSIALMDRGSRGVVFDGKNKERSRVYRELTRYTWLRPLLKAAVLGYMVGPEVAIREKKLERDGLTLNEFESMIEDYWQLLVDFQLVGPKNSPAGDAKNRFREASLFTWVSDGNTLISVEEGVQLVLYMLSANPLGQDVHVRAKKLCPTGGMDDYGQPAVEPACYRKKMFEFKAKNPDTSDLWTQFPILIRFFDGIKPDKQTEFREYVETAIRKPGVKPTDYFGSDDSDAVPMMFHYIEAAFLRFDVNRDGFLDKAEAKTAFPVFRTILAEKADMKPTDGKLISVFYYLLANGSPPVTDSMGAWSRFWHSAGFLWWHWTKPSFKADRLGLLQVFATLSAAPSP